jgi:hypothetical protein
LNSKNYVWLFAILSFIPLYTRNMPCTRANLIWWSSFIILGFGTAAALYYVISSIQKMKVFVEADKLVLSYSLGRIVIPTGIIKSIEFLESVGHLIRVGGLRLPGSIDVGYYASKELGRIKAILTRRKDVLLVTLKNNAKILLSPPRPRETTNLLEGYIGKGPEEPIRVYSKDRLVFAVTLLIIFLILGYAVSMYDSLPEQVPTKYGKDWTPIQYGSKKTFSNIMLIMFFVSLIILLVGDWLSKSIPGLQLVTAPIAISISLIPLSLMMLAICT